VELAVGENEEKALADRARRLAAGAVEDRGLEFSEGVRSGRRSAA
jgi:hypothetical protein